MKAKTIIIPILNNEYKVIVVIGDNDYLDKTAYKWNYNKGDVFLDENKRGACFYRSSCHPIIALRVFPKTPQEIGTLAHEALHAVYDIIYTKIEEKNPAEEIIAHSVGAIVRTVLEES